MHRGYGYVEYRTKEMAEVAVARLNNFSLHGSNLQVSWVSAVGRVLMTFLLAS